MHGLTRAKTIISKQTNNFCFNKHKYQNCSEQEVIRAIHQKCTQFSNKYRQHLSVNTGIKFSYCLVDDCTYVTTYVVLYDNIPSSFFLFFVPVNGFCTIPCVGGEERVWDSHKTGLFSKPCGGLSRQSGRAPRTHQRLLESSLLYLTIPRCSLKINK